MRKCILALTVIILASLQLIWPGVLIFFSAKPDLLLIFMAAAVFYLDFKTALVLGILAGLLKDVFLPAGLAVNTISFSIWSYLIYRLSSQVSTENTYIRLAIVLIVAILNNISIGFQSVRTGNNIPAGIFLRNLFIPSVYTAALSPLVFKLTRKITA